MRDSLMSGHFFSPFSELEKDYQAFQAFVNTSDTLAGIGVITNLRMGDLALGLILDLRAYSFDWDQKIKTVKGATASYQGHPIYRFQTSSGHSIAAAKYRNLLLLGRESLQVEAAISALKGKSRLQLPKGALNTKQIELHLIPENLTALGNGIFFPPLKRLLPGLSDCATHVKMQWQITASGIHIKGKWYSATKSPATSGQQDTLAYAKLLSYLPASAQWCRVNMDLSSCHKPSSTNRSIKDAYFKSWQGDDEALMAWPQLNPEKTNQIFIIQHRDAKLAQNALSQLTQSLGSIESFTYLDVFDAQQVAGKRALQDFGLEWMNPWWVILEDFVVFASSKEALTHYLDDYLVGNHLQQSESFLQFLSQQKPGNSWFYSPSMNYTFEGANWISQEAPTYRLFFKQLFAQFPKTFWSIRVNQSFEGVLVKPEKADVLQLVWSSQLSGTPMHPPQIVHWKSAEKALLIQQSNGDLSLYSLDGRVAWRSPVDEPIIGTIQNLSVNGRFQYAFNTSKYLYLVDESGRNSPPFPIALPDTACNPVLSVDLDHNERYYHFVAGKKKSLYAFAPSGDLLRGWSPLASIDSTLSTPMRHFQYNNMDFLLALSDAGTLYAFKRDGTPRFDSIPTNRSFRSPLYFQNENNWQRIAWGDQHGLTHIVNTAGASFRLSLVQTPAAPCLFAFENILGDDRKDYISLCGNTLVVNYYEGQSFQKAWEQKLDFTADQLLLFPNAWIGLSDSQNRKIYLMDKNGQLLNGFPVAGDKAFDLTILPDGSHLLVVAYEDSLYAYRIMP
ncbi:MAG TPA: hypothetical protein PKA00_17735 [Saprospiraceae bacterium]|nr:hypothetical protein [Saprospiraceae bacterium]HMQ84764.1 hypothetical protein [Saprospiraceae bacterium]